MPVAVSLVALIAAIKLVPAGDTAIRRSREFDAPGAIGMTAAMLLFVFTLVEAPTVGWLSTRTLVSFANGRCWRRSSRTSCAPARR